MVKEIHKNGIGILDRSIFGDKIFAEMLNEDGYMTNDEYDTYKSLLNNMSQHISGPNVLLYIDCDLETALKRIQIRGREMDSVVTTII